MVLDNKNSSHIDALGINFEYSEEFRAELRNKYRTFFQKLILEPVTKEDMILEKADEYSIDTDIFEDSIDDEDTINIDEIVNRIVQVHGFELQSLDQIKREEYIRFKVVPIIEALEKNKYERACRHTKKLISNTENIKSHEILKQVLVPLIAGYLRDNDFDQIFSMIQCYCNESYLKYKMQIFDLDKNYIQNLTKPMIIKKMINLLNNQDGENFVDAYNILQHDIHITKEDFKDIPPEVMRHEDIFNAIKKDIIKKVNKFPETSYVWNRDIWVNKGMVPAGDIDKSPEIQEIIKNRLIDSMNISAELYAENRDVYAAKGIINPEEMNKLPEIQEIAKNKLINKININPEIYTFHRDVYAAHGIINAEEMDKIVGYKQ